MAQKGGAHNKLLSMAVISVIEVSKFVSDAIANYLNRNITEHTFVCLLGILLGVWIDGSYIKQVVKGVTHLKLCIGITGSG